VRVALTRAVSPSIARCQLTHRERRPIDLSTADRQHRAYQRRLADLGCDVRPLAPQPDLPDAVFVEDAAVVLDELALIARPGAAARRPEVADVAAALAPHRRLVRIEAPGTMDGGDVLVVGKTVFVGRSSRTNEPGFEQIRHALTPLGYAVAAVSVTGCLHLKSAVTCVARDTVLLDPRCVAREAFSALQLVDVHPDEPDAANALLVGDTVISPAGFPRTHERLHGAGITVVPVDVSELAKAEGGVTCCSLIFEP
jgi:dimethylargininase